MGVVATVVFVAVAVADGWRAFGKRAEGARRARMEASPQYHEGTFSNPQPLWNDVWGSVTTMFAPNPHGDPRTAVPVVEVGRGRFATPPPSGLRVTWLGHSTTLIEVDGFRVLTDPVWGLRTAPLTWMGPKRWYAPPLPLKKLPQLDAIVLSHDHYDHLDYPTIRALKDVDTTWFAPLGVGAHLVYWGVPESRIVTVDWGDQKQLQKAGRTLTVHCTASRHASGRQVLDQNATLWAGYALVGDTHRVFYSGDTGLFPGMKDIGAQLGPFDLTLVEVGAYNPAWPDWHLGPEQAVEAHTWLRGQAMLPIHWGLFNLASHGWTEPIERTLAEARRRGVRVLTPPPGGSVEPTRATKQPRWWPDVPWKKAHEVPIVATGVDGRRTRPE